jgi:hypothetical protein
MLEISDRILEKVGLAGDFKSEDDMPISIADPEI